MSTPSSNTTESIPVGAGFRDEIQRFTREIDSLSTSLPVIIELLKAIRETSAGRATDFLAKHAIESTQHSDRTTYTLEISAAQMGLRLKRHAENAEMAYTLIFRGFLTSLVSQYDSFLGGLIKQVLLAKPEILKGSEKAMSFGELLKFTTIAEARSHVVEKEVESIIRKSHTEHFQWLEKVMAMTLREGLDVWPIFIEATERRNLFVHCNGIVSSQYLTVCQQHNVKLDNEINVGTQLGVTREYMNDCCNCFFEIAVKLTQVIWRKLLPNDIEAADKNLMDITFDLISGQKYKLAAKILDFACCVLKKHANEDFRRRFILNRAQAYKWANDEPKCAEVLKAEDWSACSAVLNIAAKVLSDQFTEATQMLKQLKAEPGFPDAFKFWPIFKNFRKSPEFLTEYNNVFGVPFTIEQTTPGKSSS